MVARLSVLLDNIQVGFDVQLLLQILGLFGFGVGS